MNACMTEVRKEGKVDVTKGRMDITDDTFWLQIAVNDLRKKEGKEAKEGREGRKEEKEEKEGRKGRKKGK
jgi:hypothetical protein